MENVRTQVQMKEEIMKCAHICGGITGKNMDALCNDETLIQFLLENGNLRKIPVEIKCENGEKRTMFLFDEMTKNKQIQFPNMVEENARKIAILNSCFIEHKNIAKSWFDQDDIKRFISNFQTKTDRVIPKMMFYTESELVAVYINRKAYPLTEEEKKFISNNLLINSILEYCF